jgi:hypothetical protein
MIVLVRLNEGVSPEDYERWVLESYAPAVRDLPSVSNWRNHRSRWPPPSPCRSRRYQGRTFRSAT